MLAALPLLRRLLLPCLLLLIVPVSTKLVNTTVDDTVGDPTGQSILTFSPSDKWSLGQDCPGCNVHSGNTSSTVDVSQVLDGTWHDTTYHPNIAGDSEHVVTLKFIGSAVYAYNIIANQIPFTTTLTNLTFSIDGDPVGTYVHIPENTTNTFEYGVLVYANTSLPYTSHVFVMSAGGPNDSLVLFDYLVYTQDSDNSSSALLSGSSSTGSISLPSTTSLLATSLAASSSSKSSSPPISAIVGGVVGGVVGLVILGLLLFLCVRARRQEAARRPPPAAEKIDPFVFGGAQRHSGRRMSRAPILPDLRLGRSRLMPRGPGSTTTTDASSSTETQTADGFQGHRPRLPPMSPAETARSREAAEYASRIQALEAQVRALEVQQQLSPGPVSATTSRSDASGSRTQVSQGSTSRTRRSRSRNRSGRSGRSANANASASAANLRSELASLRSEIAALRGELSQDQLGVFGAAPSYMS